MSATIPTQWGNNSTRLAIQAIQDEATKPLHVEIEHLRHDADRYQQCMADLAGEVERLNADVEALQSDISRHVAICAEQAVEIERLRHDADRYQQCMRDLSGEIERLSARNAELLQILQNTAEASSDERDELRATIERLRAALTAAVEQRKYLSSPYDTGWNDAIRWINQHAAMAGGV